MPSRATQGCRAVANLAAAVALQALGFTPAPCCWFRSFGVAPGLELERKPVSKTVPVPAAPKPLMRDDVARQRRKAARLERCATWSIGLFVLSALAWSAVAMLGKSAGMWLREDLVVPMMVMLAVSAWLSVWHSNIASAWGPEANFDRMARLYLLAQVSPNTREFVDEVLAQGRVIRRSEVSELLAAYGKLADEELARRFSPTRTQA